VGRSDVLGAIGPCLCVVASWIAGPRAALGAEDPDRTVVDIAIAGSDREADALVAALGDRVPRLGLRMRVERRQEAPPESPWPSDAVAGVWIDARATDRVDVRMTSAGPDGTRRAYDRSLAVEGSVAVVAEEVAQVVGAELESMQASAPAPSRGVPAAPSETASSPPVRPPPPAPPQPPASGGFALDLLAFVSERAVSSLSGPVFGAGVAADVSVGRAPWRPSLWIGATYDARFDAMQTRQVTFDVGTTSFRLLPSVELVELQAMQVDVGVGGGLDLFQVAPLAVRGSMAVIDPPQRSLDPVLGGQLLMRLRLASRVRLVFGFVLDYDCLLRSTTVPDDRPGGHPSTFEPWRLRPAVQFGLCVPLSSGGACADPR
jgi:hypothetical protein